MDVTVVIPFSDDEEHVGRLVQRLAAHLESLGLSNEIIAVSDDTGDNSVALLGWLAHGKVPNLRVLLAESGRAVATAVGQARGRVLWLCDVGRADVPLAPFSWAVERVLGDLADVIVLDGRYVIARRTRAWAAVSRARGRGDAFARRLTRHALLGGLRVERVAKGRDFEPAHARAHLWDSGVRRARTSLWGRVLATYGNQSTPGMVSMLRAQRKPTVGSDASGAKKPR